MQVPSKQNLRPQAINFALQFQQQLIDMGYEMEPDFLCEWTVKFYEWMEFEHSLIEEGEPDEEVMRPAKVDSAMGEMNR